jgi:hypothetical protein
MTNKNELINSIIHDKEIWTIIYYLSLQEIYDLNTYLENKLYYHLFILIKSETICIKLISYYNLAITNNLNYLDVLLNLSQRGGENIVMKGITTTLRSFLEKSVDKNRIDAIFRQGALERKAYLKSNNKKSTVKKTVINDNIISTISTKDPQHLNEIHTNLDPLNLVNKKNTLDNVVDNYTEGLKELEKIPITNPIDLQISQPLDEPPIGKIGVTVVTNVDNKLINKVINEDDDEYQIRITKD